MSLSELPAHLVEKARKELNEDPKTRMQSIEDLRQKTNSRPDLRIEKSDKDLIKFLRARKFDLDRAFDLMVDYYECKQNLTELFGSYSPSREMKTFESGFNVTFPERDQEGRKVFVFRPGFWDPAERQLIDNLRANLIAIEILLDEEETQISGIVIIADFREFGFSQAKAMQPSVFQTYGRVLLNCFPVRIKGIHIMQQPAIFTVIFTIISQFMKEKLRKRVRMHGADIAGLQKFINKELIPSDYGGDGAPTDTRAWIRFVMGSEEDLEHLWM